jgi:peptidoglycan/xylan/chitin deacetylase (PgdA/CDA1 family)
MRARLKAVLGWMAFRSGLYRRFFRNRAVIVLFHRVDDRYRGNPLSCTRAQFVVFLRFFRRFFRVVSLEELLERLRDGKGLGGYMVITFDDGYLDNYRNAAPELIRHGLPACFFIATEFVASERVPRWDADAGISSEWMSWDDVRSLRAHGFEIGSHTMNHVDLGILAGDEARREISGSKDRLERELGGAVPYFTYPFGRRHQITEGNRKLVQEAGFTCCLSAYGGSIFATDLAFHLKRTPVSPWYISPYQFGFEAMLENPEGV